MTNAWSFLHDEIMNDSPPASSASNDRITDATEKDYKDFWESNGVTVSESGNLFLNSEYNIDSLGVDSISLNEFQIDLNNEESNMTNSVNIPDLPNAPDNNNGRWKYNEDVILKDIHEYVSATYRSHYTGKVSVFKGNQNYAVQTIDLLAAKGLASNFCQANILKYGSRYGDKDGKNKKDLLKVIHYAMLLLHFDDHYKSTNSDFPY